MNDFDYVRTPPPADLRPMLATLVHQVPEDDGWAYEMKWDGIRALARAGAGQLELHSRDGNDVTAGYPELGQLGTELGATELLLDGEIVALNDRGSPSFQRLQSRMHVRDPSAVRRLTQHVPIVYMIFDLLWLDGELLLDAPYRRRRQQLDALRLTGIAWQTPAIVAGTGTEALATSRRLGFEGVVAKRVNATYLPGRRSPDWRKIKHQRRQEFVIGGWEAGKGTRSGRIGALLLGYYDSSGTLRYAGKVGTGFTEAVLDDLLRQLQAHATATSPFSGPGVPRHGTFVEPSLVAEVRFTEWTDGGRLRHPAYLGLRPDKIPREVRREVETDTF
jgi:bifunctional non-homologous end joining protein LigD